MLSLVSCKKNCSLEYEIIDKKYVIPYYYGTNQILIETGELNYERYKRINNFEDELIPIYDSYGNLIRFYDVFDGGDHHFQAVINTKTNTFRVIHINGEA